MLFCFIPANSSFLVGLLIVPIELISWIFWSTRSIVELFADVMDAQPLLPNVLNCNDLWRYGFPNVLKNWFINVEGNSSFNLPENAEGHSFMSELSSRVLGENISNGYEPPKETF